MITRVRVKNYRSIAEADVTLGPLTVLVGRNGSGKSTFVDVLRFVRDAIWVGLETAIVQRHGITGLRRWSSRGRPYDLEIDLTVQEPELWGEYSLVISSGQNGEYRVKREICRCGNSEDAATVQFESHDSKWVTPPPGYQMDGARIVTTPWSERIDTTVLGMASVYFHSQQLMRMRGHLVGNAFYSMFPNTLREPQKPLGEHSLMEAGENLATVVKALKRKKRFSDLIRSLGRVVEGVSDIRVRQVGGYLVTELKHETSGSRSPWFELAQESDGTLRMLGLLVALHLEVDHGLIAIEEPELTIHPGALGVLSDEIREASQRTQVLITTQSPDLISRFGADELRIVERKDGISYIGPVDETQREAINEELFSAGDLLRIEGLHPASSALAGRNNA